METVADGGPPPGAPSDRRASVEEGYLRYTGRKRLFLILMSAVVLTLSVLTIRVGATDLGYAEILRYLFFPDGSWNSIVVWELRMPVILAGLLAGCTLGVAGSVMQSVLRNPLASPFTLGLSNAAAFGASLAIVFGGGAVVGSYAAYSVVSEPLMVTLFAFAFSMAATGVVVLLVKFTDASPESIVLAGLAISSIFSALLSMIQFMANDVALSNIVFWQFGSLDKVALRDLVPVLAVALPASVYFMTRSWSYNALEAGEEIAVGLGINIDRTRIAGLTVSAMVTAVTVSYLGIIGFVGLIGPHIVKRMVGNDSRYVLPGSMLVGGMVLLVSNLFATHAFYTVIPVGIVTSAIGGPMFLYILIRRHGKGC